MNRSSTADTKPNIIVHGGNVVVGGTQVQGDQIAGGGQKGDKVEVNRDTGKNILVTNTGSAIESDSETTCPSCHKTSPLDAKFCQHCRTPLK